MQSTLPGPHPAALDVGDGAAQEIEAVGTGEGGIGVGEVLADVAEAGGTEQGVRDGVRDHVRIAVAGQAPLARRTRPRPARADERDHR